ncbi:hypothetical protein PFISCL1PPCAC_24375, partial [Pristionchus fissidentatus]
MNDLQRKMVAAAEEMVMKGKEKDVEAKEKGYRKRVFEAIMALSDAVDEKIMMKHLPYLDRSSWSEVAEERFLAQLCALPSCGAEVKREKKAKGDPMYKIDRIEGKIYESGHADRLGFCTRECYDRFESLREQLPQEPLWVTGQATVSSPSVSSSRSSRRSMDGEERRVEIVKDSLLVSRLDNLFIAERDGNSSEEEREEGKEERGEGMVQDSEFLSSIHRYCTVSSGGMKKEGKKEEEKMEVDEKKEEKKDKRSEEEKLKNRQSAPKRKAMLTEAKPLTSEQLRQEERMQEQAKREKPSEPVAQEPSNGMTAEELEELPEETIPFTKYWEIPAQLFVDWLNRRTTEVVRMGGRRPVNEVDRLLKRFYAGDKAEALENQQEEVRLPMVDGCDVRKRRIDIMLTSIKPTFSSLESHLNVRSTRLEDVHSIVASLSLDSHSITGWSKREIRVITLGLWRIVCMLSDELENDFFPNGVLSNEMRSLLELWQLEENVYCRLVKMIEGRVAMFETTEK